MIKHSGPPDSSWSVDDYRAGTRHRKTRRNVLIVGGIIAMVMLTIALSQLEARPEPTIPGKGSVSELDRWIDDSLGVACYRHSGFGGPLSCVKYK